MSEEAVKNQEDKKPYVQSTHITLKVQNQDEVEILFRIKKTAKLELLMNWWCHKLSLQLDTVRFLYDGTPILSHQTPEELEMEDMDKIDVFAEQLGGALITASHGIF